MDFTKLNQHTRLCRWIVYSRATTSAIALRWVLPAGFLVFALGAIVCGGVVSWCSNLRVARIDARARDSNQSFGDISSRCDFTY
jgi:hypothetical protein